MNWEVASMKSRISLFDRGVSRSLLRRFWPLWTGYALILLLRLPLRLPQIVTYGMVTQSRIKSVSLQIVSNAEFNLLWAAIAGVVIAGAMFGFLYRSRMCHLMNSLPIRRETMFFTAWLTGLVPMLLADLLTYAVVAAIALPSGLVSSTLLLKWLAVTVLGNLAFYNFAVFCAMLTGSRALMPLIFLMLNFIVGLTVLCVAGLLELCLYGYSMQFPDWATFLTPPVQLIKDGVTGLVDYYSDVQVSDLPLGSVAAYAGISLLFLGLGLWLYRRRQMETAGDAVAVRWAKPVLKILFLVGFALSFTAIMLLLTSGGAYDPPFFTMWCFLLIGCFLGYFIAEMLLHRTVKVFRGHWKGFFIAAAAFTVFALVLNFDLFGYERYVPAQEDVVCVRFDGLEGRVAEPENVADAIELHREALALRGKESGSGWNLEISYELKNGRTVRRSYLVPESLYDRAVELRNRPESLMFSVSGENGLRSDNIQSAVLIIDVAGDRATRTETITLTAEELTDLLENGLRPDAAAGTLGLLDKRGINFYSNTVHLEIFLKEPNLWGYLTAHFYLSEKDVHSFAWITDFLSRDHSSQVKVL